MIRALLIGLAVALILPAAESTALDLAHMIRDAGLDSGECYRVRDLSVTKEDLRIYFNDGYLLFSKPVNGKRLWVLYSGENEGGDAEVLIMPPHRSERRSLASFAGSPNLNEHFRSAFFVATDSTTVDLLERARASGKKSPEQGTLLAEQYAQTARLLAESFAMRLVQDLMNDQRPESGLFFGTLGNTRLGNLDVMYDPSSREQILVGQVANSGGRTTFDVWCSFESRSVRKGAKRMPQPLTGSNFRIEASLDDNLLLDAVTRAKIRVQGTPMRALPFLISGRMRVTEARFDGQPAEIFSRESIRESAIRGGADELFLVVPPVPVQTGVEHELEIHHSGAVVMQAGNNVFYVGSRGTWYPHQPSQYATFDLTFRYPKALTLVATGTPAEDRTEGERRVSRYVANVPIRFAGFNLGEYHKITLSKGGYTVDVYANRALEPELAHRPEPVLPPIIYGPRHPGEALGVTPPALTAPPDPNLQLREIAGQVEGALEYMTAQFGPMPLKSLMVAPIPGMFGQGFPGLVYLSTFAYLSPTARASTLKDKSQQLFFSDLLVAHEVAHQWWGNLITTEAYQDEWIMEALANYSALMYLEKRKGVKALEQALDDYRTHLLARREPAGKTVEGTGPITLGTRLMTAQGETAWRTILYEKGSWIIHMLRRMMGDEAFSKMLAELTKRYAYQAITTEDFRRLVAEFVPRKVPDPTLENFFETWVYGTGIPTVKVEHSLRGKSPTWRVSGTVTRTGVEGDFSADVPVEIQFAKGPPITTWVRTSDEPSSFSFVVRQPPTRVGVAAQSILAVRR